MSPEPIFRSKFTHGACRHDDVFAVSDRAKFSVMLLFIGPDRTQAAFGTGR